MSAGYGPPSVNTFGMITGIGKTFNDSYDAGVKERQEREAPEILSKLFNAQSAAASAPTGTLGTLTQGYLNPGGAVADTAQDGASAKLPSFAGGNTAPLRVPGSGGEIESKFVDALKAGGLTNPYGLGAMTAYAGRESGFKGSNVTGSWSDPSESGQPGTSGGILSWRGDRFGNMQRMTAGASDPVAAQAKFALVENPDLTLALQQAKSPEEANALMAQAWKFAGWDRQGGESAARLASTRAYAASLGGTPAASGAPANAPRMAAAGAAPAQGGDDGDAADKPVPGAVPAGFVIPGQGAAAPIPAASATPQGFAGFGSAASRISPDQQEALAAAWKNPITRPMATAVYGEILKGKQSQWQLSSMGGQPVLFNQTTAQIVPVGQAKRDTATVGNVVIDTATGQPIYQGEEKPMVVGGALVSPSGRVVYEGKDDKYTYQNIPGVGMAALHPTDPAKSRVIIQGQQPRAMTPEEAAQFSKGYYGADGAPHIPSAGVQILPAEKEKDKKIGEAVGSEIADAINAGRPAQDKLQAIGIMRDAFETGADKITTGPMAENVLRLKQFAKGSLGIDVDGLPNSEIIQKIGTQLATANAKSLTSRPTQFDFATYLKNNPGLLLSPEGNRGMLDILQQQAQREYDLSRLATKKENQEDFGATIDAYDKAHPLISPFTKQPIKTSDVNAPGPGGASRQVAQAQSDTDRLGEAGGPGTMPPAPSDQAAGPTVPTPGGGTRLAIPPRVANALRSQPDTAESRAAFDQQYGAGAAQGVLKKPLPATTDATGSQGEGQARQIPTVVKGGRPPDGYSWDSYLAGAQQKLRDRPDLRPQLEERLAKAGIDPRKLGK